MSFPFPIVGPIAPETNPLIHPDWYQPRNYFISDITFGKTTIVTTETDHDYVVGQEIRLLIPKSYGAFQLNNAKGFVISIPSSTQVEININSSEANSFLTDPFTVTITGASQASFCVLTTNTNFNFVNGNSVTISDVSGMTELNDETYAIITSNSTTITIEVNSLPFTPYTSGGIAQLFNYETTQPQIIPIGNINSGAVNTAGRINNSTYIPGSFIDISPV